MSSSLNLPPLPSVPQHVADPSLAALDGFKLACADFLCTALDGTGLTIEQCFDAVEAGKTGKGITGDFVVAVPRFRLKSMKPQEIVDKLLNAVSNPRRAG